jgi:cytolysin-activating lysine-acyltransferase
MSKTTAGASANGSSKMTSAPETTPKTAAKTRPAESRQARMAQSFSQIVAVLMRDPNFKNLKLADLEWLVIPAVMSGQFELAHARTQPGPDKDKAKDGGIFVPVAVALWAHVSPAVDKTLSENLDKPLQLRPNQWVSGDIAWLVAAAGDQRAVPTFLKQLGEKKFKGKPVKLRARGPDGSVVIKTLAQYA